MTFRHRNTSDEYNEIERRLRWLEARTNGGGGEATSGGTGEAGPVGPTGPPGADGSPGADGLDGIDGLNAGLIWSMSRELILMNIGQPRFYIPEACVITNVIASVGTPPQGANIRIDVNKNTDTIFTTQSTRPNIVANTISDTLSVPQITELNVLDFLTVDIDQVGSTFPGANLTVQVIVERP